MLIQGRKMITYDDMKQLQDLFKEKTGRKLAFSSNAERLKEWVVWEAEK
jgi:hypothetical protein